MENLCQVHTTPSPIVEEDLTHLQNIQFIFPPERIQSANSIEVSSRYMSQAEEMEQECNLGAQDVVGSEYVELDTKEGLKTSDFELKPPIVPFFTFKNQTGLEIKEVVSLGSGVMN